LFPGAWSLKRLRSKKGCRDELKTNFLILASSLVMKQFLIFTPGRKTNRGASVRNSFDFSCLGDRKTLLGGENLNTLKEVIISRAHSVRVDDSYNAVRTLLDFAWPSEQETQSQGWRRERPGKYSLGAATVNSNETQFSRYSRLQRHFSLPASN
jgi:hypothetical protein